MAQIVIFAPEGEDVSTGVQALKDAGHDVEVVEATAENLLHMAIGMIGDKPDADEEPKDESADEEPTPSEEDPLADEEPGEEDPKKMESLGHCVIEGESVPAFRGKITRLFVSELHRGEKITFTINESTISIWDKQHRFFCFFLATPKGEMAGASAPVYRSKFGKSYLSVGPELAHFF